MQVKPYLLIVLGAIVGFGVAQFIATPKHQQSKPITSTVAMKNDAINLQNKIPKDSLKPIKSLLAQANERLIAAGLEPVVPDEALLDENSSEANAQTSTSFAQMLNDAQTAVTSYEYENALSLFNLLLSESSNPEQRQAAVEGLVTVHEGIFDYLVNEEGQLHGALWQLFEIHKLKPSDINTQEMLRSAQQTFSQAQVYMDENNVLGSTDYLNTLRFLSSMMNFELTDENGTTFNSDNFKELASRIEQQPGYTETLNERANYNLNQGSEVEQGMVFWDFAKLAELGGQDKMANETFREQFTEASLKHLSYLKSMNQNSEVRSRMDFIRFSFPQLMQDERLQTFH